MQKREKSDITDGPHFHTRKQLVAFQSISFALFITHHLPTPTSKTQLKDIPVKFSCTCKSISCMRTAISALYTSPSGPFHKRPVCQTKHHYSTCKYHHISVKSAYIKHDCFFIFFYFLHLFFLGGMWFFFSCTFQSQHVTAEWTERVTVTSTDPWWNWQVISGGETSSRDSLAHCSTSSRRFVKCPRQLSFDSNSFFHLLFFLM